MSNQNPDANPASETASEFPHNAADNPVNQAGTGAANHFETMIAAGLNNPQLSGPVVAAFMSAEVYFLSREEVTGQNPNAQPLLVSNAAGAPMVAVFTSFERIPNPYIDQAPYGVLVQGAAIIRSLSGTGVVINPGSDLSFQIPAEGVAVLQEDLLRQHRDDS